LIKNAAHAAAVITALLTKVPGGHLGFLIISNIALFLLGVFLEFIEICFIAMPLFVPAAQALGIDMIWFGVVMAINLQTAFISPPVGFSLFYLPSVAPKEVSTLDIHKSAFPFMVLQFIVLVIVMLFPETVRFLIDISATT
jgi:TRAP-type mannitol/chloroaromatic compound transport system permease large subunit